VSAPAARLNQTACSFRHVRWSFAHLPCPHCAQPAPRTDDIGRVAIDLDLDRPVLLQVTVSRHHCAPCRRYFRAQPPFLRPDATYTIRVVGKAVEAVYQDGLAMRRVAARLARDFWVRPSEGSIRHWCRAARTVERFVQDYQPWVIAEFSGILCIDEVYQGQLALLLAVDPAAPTGDRVVGYQLVTGTVTQAEVRVFLRHLASLGIAPAEVVTDGSALYPKLLAEIWPTAAHQLCLFHETRRVTAAVQQVYHAVRATVPQPPAAWAQEPGVDAAGRPPRPQLRGRPRKQPPAPESTAPRDQQWQQRHALRQAGIAQVHALAQHGLSQRAVARVVGIARATVDAWLKEPVPALPSEPAASGEQTLALPLAVPDVPPPPAPWATWAEVRQVRETLTASRFLLVQRPDHLTTDEQAQLSSLLASPLDASLRVARAFLEEWYAFWRDEQGQRRSPEEAQTRYQAWRTNPAYLAVAPLAAVITTVDERRFTRLSQFLRHPTWEATNNGAERAGRAFRHLQGPHFNLRTCTSIEQALAARALGCRPASSPQTEPQPNRSTRGRRSRRREQSAAA
jgi:hypothetical protein